MVKNKYYQTSGKRFFALDQHKVFVFYSARSLKKSYCRHGAPLAHIILIQAKHYLLLLINALCFVEKQQIPIS